MFRKMRRFNQEVSFEQCQEILKTEKRGVLSVIGDDGYPYGIPMNFYYDEAENTLYFHCAKEGHKVDAVRKCDKACFTVLNKGYKDEGDWAWHITSVIAMGKATLIDDKSNVIEKLRKIGIKYYPNEQEADAEIEKGINRVQVIALKILHMSGKSVYEK